MQLEFLNEHAWSPYPVLAGMVETEPSTGNTPNLPEISPMFFQLRAKKTGIPCNPDEILLSDI
jgi:hypothetical protein